MTRARATTATCLLLLMACSDGGGSCAGQVPYPSPAQPGGEILNGAVTAQLTAHFLTFLETRAALLLGEALTIENGRASFVLDPSTLGAGGAIGIAPGYASSVSFDVAD